MNTRILVTLGPASFIPDIIKKIDEQDIFLFRINMSHTPIEKLEKTISQIQEWTNVPICIDSEGAQVRNHRTVNGKIVLGRDEFVKIHFDKVLGDSENISFSPDYIAPNLQVGDEIKIDFNAAHIKVVEKLNKYCMAKVIRGGLVGSNKAVNISRRMKLNAITDKDKMAIKIGREMGIKHFALSFAGAKDNVLEMRSLVGDESSIISKVESVAGLLNLQGILEASDEILIDRGDLSREVQLEKIPFMQRRIISFARSKGVPVYVATNLLESMTLNHEPTRAEINDVTSTLLMGANGLVLAAETAIGDRPLESVIMTRRLINQYEKWTVNTTLKELLFS